MRSLPDEPAWIREYAGELAGRIEFLADCGSHPPVLTRGVLFLMAFWSGPAVLGFKRLCGTLRNTGLPDDFTFTVLDIDGVSGELHAYLFSCRQVRTGGAAEAYWFRKGGIFADTNCATGTDERIRQLLLESGSA